MIRSTTKAKPFLKWAGGKTQLLPKILSSLPSDFGKGKVTYIEPFVGSGAVLLCMLQRFPNIEQAVINDVNADLVNLYRTIKGDPAALISMLTEYQATYHALEGNEDKKRDYYLKQRTIYNNREKGIVDQAALFIFLNRTCFNGLYRVNSKNLFNVPMGGYKKPTICDAANIWAVSQLLQKVEIRCGDYQETLVDIGGNSFFYFDPPYKPLNMTSNFNSYAQMGFGDTEQVRLREFCEQLDRAGIRWMLSNSDVPAHAGGVPFFDALYADHHIQKVEARRSINSKGEKRGKLNEILVTNYFPSPYPPKGER